MNVCVLCQKTIEEEAKAGFAAFALRALGDGSKEPHLFRLCSERCAKLWHQGRPTPPIPRWYAELPADGLLAWHSLAYLAFELDSLLDEAISAERRPVLSTLLAVER